MIDKINSLISLLDVGDIKFFFLVAKKNIKNLIILSLITSILVLFFSLNQEKKYLSKGIIVIEPDDSNIVNIEEVYSLETRSNRINNQMAILKSDQVLEYIIKDKKPSNRGFSSLRTRIILSVLLFTMLIVGYYLDLIKPHGI